MTTTLLNKDRLDPNDIDTFTWNWGSIIAGTVTIAAFVATVAAGTATISGSAISGTLTTATVGSAIVPSVSILGQITTSDGRRISETIVIPVGDQ